VNCGNNGAAPTAFGYVAACDTYFVYDNNADGTPDAQPNLARLAARDRHEKAVEAPSTNSLARRSVGTIYGASSLDDCLQQCIAENTPPTVIGVNFLPAAANASSICQCGFTFVNTTSQPGWQSAIIAPLAAQAYQNASYNCLSTFGLVAQVPECARACQVGALMQDGCPFDDLTCHCVQRTQFIIDLLSPCLTNNSTCIEADVKGNSQPVPKFCFDKMLRSLMLTFHSIRGHHRTNVWLPQCNRERYKTRMSAATANVMAHVMALFVALWEPAIVVGVVAL